MKSINQLCCCCCLPTPSNLKMEGGVRSSACGPSISFSIHLVSSAVTPVGYVYKSMGDNVVRMKGILAYVGESEEMVCVVWVGATNEA